MRSWILMPVCFGLVVEWIVAVGVPNLGIWVASTVLGSVLCLNSCNFGVDAGERCKAFESVCTLGVLLVSPVLPALHPGLEITTLIKVDVQFPVHRNQPLVFQSVQFGNGDTADLGPGSVLKGVVVEELASEKQTNGQHAPNLAVGCLVLTGRVEVTHTTRKVVHSQKNCGAWESSGREKAGAEFAKGRRDGCVSHNNALSHLCNVIRHLVNFVVKVRADAADRWSHDGQSVLVDRDSEESRSGSKYTVVFECWRFRRIVWTCKS